MKDLNQSQTEKEWKGIVAFNRDSAWFVDKGDNTHVTNLQRVNIALSASSDVTLNNVDFTDQIVECGWEASFDVKSMASDSFFVLQYPKILTHQHYNFIVSNGDYVSYDCELGDVSITIDQSSGPGTTGIRQTRALPIPPKGKLVKQTSAFEQIEDIGQTSESQLDRVATGEMTTATEFVEKDEAGGTPSASSQSPTVMETPRADVASHSSFERSRSMHDLKSLWRTRSFRSP